MFFKVLFLGEGGVGKTSLLKRYVEGTFTEDMKTTVGVDFASCEVGCDGWKATLQIWDLAGQMHFRDLVSYYFAGGRAAIAVFDITMLTTMDALEGWITRLYEAEGEIPLVIVGNKGDLRSILPPAHPFITQEEGRRFAEKYGAPFIEASAKDGNGVSRIFDEVTRLLSERYPGLDDSPPLWD